MEDKKGYTPVAGYEARPGEVKRVLLLYSGGLDSSVMIPWIKERYGCEVVTLTVNLGQFMDEMETVRQRALSLGADDAVVADAVEEFAGGCLTRAVKANGCYDGYYLSTPLGRAVSSEVVARVAEEVGADAVGHGCTGKGNDQVRFDAGVLTLAPHLKVIAPVRQWNMGRDEEYEFARAHGIVVEQLKKCPYSHDDNIWGITSEGHEIENPACEPPLERILRVCNTPENAPDVPQTVRITFERGLPVALDGRKMNFVEMIKTLNSLAALHAVGFTVLIEDRIVGLKVRGVYESPAAHVIISAHKALEALVLSKEELAFKRGVDAKWAQLVYDGKWFEPLRSDLDAFVDAAGEHVTGTVTMKMSHGTCTALAVESRYSLCDEYMATFNAGDYFNNNAAAPFIELYSLQMRHAVKVRGGNGAPVASAAPVV